MASHVDVLIIGAGPSGLMAALWLARCGIHFRIIDKNTTKSFRGHADSLQIRTMEIFESFGIADALQRKGAPLVESNHWTSGEDGNIKRTFRLAEWSPELGRLHQVMISQGQTELELLKGIERFGGPAVERGVVVTDLIVDSSSINDSQAYGVTVTLKHLTDEELVTPFYRSVPSPGDHDYDLTEEKYRARKPSRKEGTTEVIKARYVIGCDGTQSITRQKLGFDFAGPPKQPVGGIVDCFVETDFPDIYTRTVVSNRQRPLMIIPREKGMVRIGVQFDTCDANEVTRDMVFEVIKDLLQPFKIEFKHCDWFGRYQSSQRLSSGFSKAGRVFLAGDAMHTHSPKAGIGMNFSLQDTYNLGWKLAHVIKGIAKAEILETYDIERGFVAKELIKYDKALSVTFVSGDFSVDQFAKQLTDGFPFTTGTAVEYPPGPLVARSGWRVASKENLASRAVVGRRLLTSRVFTHARGLEVNLEEYFLSDGKYRILVFTGDMTDRRQFAKVQQLSDLLERPDSFVQGVTRGNTKPRDVFDIALVHTSRRDEFEISQFPKFLISKAFPSTLDERVFVDHEELRAPGTPGPYLDYGIANGGCLILLRPDRHIMYIGEVEDVGDVNEVMSSVLVRH